MAIKEEERGEFPETKVDNGLSGTDVNVRTGMTNDQFDMYQRKDVDMQVEFKDELYDAVKRGDIQKVKELTGWTRDATRPDDTIVTDLTKQTQDNADIKEKEDAAKRQQEALNAQNAGAAGAEGQQGPVDSLMAFMMDPFGLTKSGPPAAQAYSGESLEEAVRRGDWSAAARIMNAIRAREQNEKQDFSGDGVVSGGSSSGSAYGPGTPDMYGGTMYYDNSGNWQYQDQYGNTWDSYGKTYADGSWEGTNGTSVSAKEPTIIHETDGTTTDLVKLGVIKPETPPQEAVKITVAAGKLGEDIAAAVDGTTPTNQPPTGLAANANSSPNAKPQPPSRANTPLEKEFRNAALQHMAKLHPELKAEDIKLSKEQWEALRKAGDMRRAGQNADAYLKGLIAKEQAAAGVPLTYPLSTTAPAPAPAPQPQVETKPVVDTETPATDINLNLNLSASALTAGSSLAVGSSLGTSSLSSGLGTSTLGSGVSSSSFVGPVDYSYWDDDPMYWSDDWLKSSAPDPALASQYDEYRDSDGGYWDEYGYNDKNGGYTWDDTAENGSLAGGYQDKNGNFVDKDGNLYLDGNYTDKPDALAANAPSGGWAAALKTAAASTTEFVLPTQDVTQPTTTVATQDVDTTRITTPTTTSTAPAPAAADPVDPTVTAKTNTVSTTGAGSLYADQTPEAVMNNFSQFLGSLTSFLSTSDASRALNTFAPSAFIDLSEPITTGSSSVWGTKFFDPANITTTGTAPTAEPDPLQGIAPTNPYYKPTSQVLMSV
ncbi:MAG: hypothetical protein EPN97_06215 [Alphaproteobacteria bacterium]|nr:MAG: hypothetical protein EPN97_06215 [Alphaproteobacteria bacterium]